MCVVSHVACTRYSSYYNINTPEYVCTGMLFMLHVHIHTYSYIKSK